MVPVAAIDKAKYCSFLYRYPQARKALTDGRGVALWNAAAELSGLECW